MTTKTNRSITYLTMLSVIQKLRGVPLNTDPQADPADEFRQFIDSTEESSVDTSKVGDYYVSRHGQSVRVYEYDESQQKEQQWELLAEEVYDRSGKAYREIRQSEQNVERFLNSTTYPDIEPLPWYTPLN